MRVAAAAASAAAVTGGRRRGRDCSSCGCNDCGALKAAHAGISLSLNEASVAAPFTSKKVHIGCVPYLIREGRSTMVSSFASFKFGVGFCFTQLIAVLMVFYVSICMLTFDFLYDVYY